MIRNCKRNPACCFSGCKHFEPPPDDLVEEIFLKGFRYGADAIHHTMVENIEREKKAKEEIRKLLTKPVGSEEEEAPIKITNMTDPEFCYREINRCKNGVKHAPSQAENEWWQENLIHFRSIYKKLGCGE